MLENNETFAAPIMTEENMFPSYSVEHDPTKCNNVNLNKVYNQYGKVGFNNNL